MHNISFDSTMSIMLVTLCIDYRPIIDLTRQRLKLLVKKRNFQIKNLLEPFKKGKLIPCFVKKIPKPMTSQQCVGLEVALDFQYFPKDEESPDVRYTSFPISRVSLVWTILYSS